MSNHGLTADNMMQQFPIALQKDPKTVALGQAIAKVMESRQDEIDSLRIYTRIDELPEWLLDILARDFAVDWYDRSYLVVAVKGWRTVFQRSKGGLFEVYTFDAGRKKQIPQPVRVDVPAHLAGLPADVPLHSLIHAGLSFTCGNASVTGQVIGQVDIIGHFFRVAGDHIVRQRHRRQCSPVLGNLRRRVRSRQTVPGLGEFATTSAISVETLFAKYL